MTDVLDRYEALHLEATPGRWRECGHDRGGCQCGQVWSEATDAPVLTVERGEWGDSYPALRTNAVGEPEAYLERIPYGEIPDQYPKPTARLIAASRNTVPAVIALAKAVDLYLNEHDEGPYPRALETALDAFLSALSEEVK